MNQLLYLGPLFYSIGSFTWNNFLDDAVPRSAFVPNLIAAIIGGVIVLLPYRLIFLKIAYDKDI